MRITVPLANRCLCPCMLGWRINPTPFKQWGSVAQTKQSRCFPCQSSQEPNWITFGKNSFASFIKCNYSKREVAPSVIRWSREDNLLFLWPLLLATLIWVLLSGFNTFTFNSKQRRSLELYFYSKDCSSLFNRNPQLSRKPETKYT